MIFIVGLGNPGMKYSGTRHNIGFEVIERIAYDNNIELNTKKHFAITGQGMITGQKVFLAMPQTYMNESGVSIRSMLDFYKKDADSLVVIYDDIALDLGGIRIREKGSAGGHNGIKSIIKHLGTDEFKRIKVGVGAKPPGFDLASYVLSRFTDDEMKAMIETAKYASDAAGKIVTHDVLTAMNEYNRKNI